MKHPRVLRDSQVRIEDDPKRIPSFPALESSGQQRIIGKMVPIPTMTASTSSLRWWTYSLDFSFVTHRESPLEVAVHPSRVMAVFAATKGRPVVTNLTNASLRRQHSSSRVPVMTSIPFPARSSASAAGHPPVGVFHPDHHLSDAASQNRFRTWGCSALVVAWLQSDIKNIPLLSASSELKERFYFGVMASSFSMETGGNDFSPAHDHCTHSRIGRSPPHAFPCKPKGQPHEHFVFSSQPTNRLSSNSLNAGLFPQPN